MQKRQPSCICRKRIYITDSVITIMCRKGSGVEMNRTARNHPFYDPIPLPEDFPISVPGFTTPPGSAHVHNCFEIGLCQGGDGGVFQIGSKIFACSPGDAVFINDREFHILSRATPSNSRWSFINLDPEKLLLGRVAQTETAFHLDRLAGRGFRNLVSPADQPRLLRLTELLFAEMREPEPDRTTVRALVWAVFGLLREMLPGETGPAPQTGPGEIRRLYPALSRIADHYAGELPIPELAQLCNMGTTTFRRLFRSQIGMLPLEYITEYRLSAAVTLLRNTDKQIIEIAARTGFPTLSQFNRLFRRHFGQSPRDYRKNRAAVNLTRH